MHSNIKSGVGLQSLAVGWQYPKILTSDQKVGGSNPSGRVLDKRNSRNEFQRCGFLFSDTSFWHSHHRVTSGSVDALRDARARGYADALTVYTASTSY